MRRTFLILYLALTALSICSAPATSTPGQAAFVAGNYEHAQEEFVRELKASPNDASVLLLLGRTQIELGDFRSATDNFERAARLAPGSPDVHYWIGVATGHLASGASLFTAGRYASKSRKAFTQAFALDAKHVGAHRGMIEFYLAAPRIFGGGVGEARATAEALRLVDDLEGRIALAKILRAERRGADAKTQLELIVTDYPSNPRALLDLGLLALDEEDYDGAYLLFTRALRATDEDVESTLARRAALYQIGRTAVFSGKRIGEGVAAFEDYLMGPTSSELPAKPWAHFRLATLYEMNGDSARAERHFELAAATDDRELRRQLARR